MSKNKQEPESIKALFTEAESVRLGLDGGGQQDRGGGGQKPAAADALALYDRCRDRVAAAALFSRNETADDVATSSLPYLLVDLRRAEMLQRLPVMTPQTSTATATDSSNPPSSHDDVSDSVGISNGNYHGNDPSRTAGGSSSATEQRALVVRRARDAYESFLALADAHGLVTGGYATLLARYREQGGGFSVTAAATGNTAAARREAKIAAFRAERELVARAEALRRDARRCEDDDDDGDEEVLRRAHLAGVELGVHSALQGLEGLNREGEMLAMAPAFERRMARDGGGGGDGDARRRRNGEEDADSSWRLDGPAQGGGAGGGGRGGGALLSAEGRPLRPFTLLGAGAGGGSSRSRAELRRGVFRPGHNLPTMSVDEYLAEEMRRGNMLSGGGDGGGGGKDGDEDEDEEGAVDRATYKAREWDDFKDENRRGAGNTLNMG